MKGLERRQTPRTTIDKHAYINIEPNNGAIVLNVSDGGLCFHSYDPVPQNGTIRFWFWDNKQRIEADGALTWSDETQKGGLRFVALPTEVREKIRDWMSSSATTVAVDEGAAAAIPRPRSRSFPSLSGVRPEIEAAPPAPVPLAVLSPELKVQTPVNGFSRGLVTGLLVSGVVVAVFSFNAYRRELGESLIRLGERFAAKPQAEVVTASAAAPAVLPAAQITPPVPTPVSPAARTNSPAPSAAPPASAKVVQAAAPISAPRADKVPPQPEKVAPLVVPSPARIEQAKLESAGPGTVIPTPASDPAPKTAAAAPAPPAVSLTPATIPLPTPAIASGSDLIQAKLDAASKPGPMSQPSVQSEGSGGTNVDLTRELYFEVGRFKNVSQAHDETGKLAELGFPATAVEKGHLWTNSFHVLVGPYGDEEQAKATQGNLLSSGFKPRPFEKGSRNFTLLSSLTLNGGRTPEGEYVISWESYIGNADVKFMRNSSVIATADGKWVKRDVKYPHDAYVYRRNPDGSRTLLEIHFGGMRQALVFGKPS
jgi:hypothetical protein